MTKESEPDLQKCDFRRSYNLYNETLTFYLSVDKNHQIENLSFKYLGTKEIKEGLNFLCQEVQGRDLFYYPKTIKSENFPLIGLIYRKFLISFRGDLIPYSEQKGYAPETLLCRCFGVYEKEILELHKSGVKVFGLKELGEHLKAGIGCGTCHQDLLEFLNTIEREDVEETSKVKAWSDYSPKDLATEIQKKLMLLNEKNRGLYEVSLKGQKPDGILLACHLFDSHQKEEINKEIMKILIENFGEEINVTILFR